MEAGQRSFTLVQIPHYRQLQVCQVIVGVLNKVLPPVRLVFFVFFCNVEQKMVITNQS